MQASRLGFWEMTVSKGRNERGGNCRDPGQPDKNALRQKDTFIPPHGLSSKSQCSENIYMALRFFFCV